MKTVSEAITWLKTPGIIKCVLADITEVGSAPSTSFYLSNVAYHDGTNMYDACITGGLSFSEALSIDGSPSMSFGSLEIVNTGGAHDDFISYVWAKRPIKIYLGDPSWPKTDFILVFDGLIKDILAPTETQISFSLFDKLQRLNDPITERTLKNTSYSQNTLDTILPLMFGECFNVSPLLVDNGSTGNTGQIYMLHDGAINGIIEVRDNGIPVAINEGLSTGTFELVAQPYGTITASAQGATSTYTDTVAGIITKLVTGYGTVENRFQVSELSFGDFTNTSSVGLYCSDRQNLLEACTEVARSVNANLICPCIVVSGNTISTSKLRLVEIKAPSGTPVYYLNDDNMIVGTLSVSEMFPVVPSVKLGYCKNYTVQQTVASGVNPTSKFDEQYWYSTATNSTNKTLYRDSGNVAEEPTILNKTTEAATEANKRLTLWQQQRYVVTARYLPELIFAQLGDIVQVTSSRFGLSGGKLGMVYSVNRDWETGQVDIGVLI
jgi:hypothetical protein